MAKRPTKPSAPAAATPRVTVRMYRQGLGDCFLVTIRRGAQPFHMLVDCGVLLGTPDAAATLQKVVQDILDTTGSRIDVLVVTHEHYDHVAGFNLAEDLFAKLAVGEVWFAWTEDPADEAAKQIRAERAAHLAALAALSGRLTGLGVGLADAPSVAETLTFLGLGADGKDMGATAKAMVKAAGLAPGKVRYFRPGDTIEHPAAPEFRIFVLGPPMDRASLVKTDSTTEVYHLDGLNLAVSGLLGHGPALSGRKPGDPFDQVWATGLADVLQVAEMGFADFLRAHYFGPDPEPPHAGLSWRRIDGAWLDEAETLALALDSYTNNTSLALAIELVASGEVLLFPADAQVGNWLSWDRQAWTVEGKAVTAGDLLRRTIFYKVGHHGSHNATLKAKGLERMPAQGLTAFIPVDHAMAHVKHWDKMPLPALVEALRERCGPQLVRIDEPLHPDAADIVGGGAGSADGRFQTLYYEWSHALGAGS